MMNNHYSTRRLPEKEMIFGIRAVIEAIDAGKVLDKILLRRDMTSTIGRELTAKLQGLSTTIQRVPVEKLNQYTDKNHQGVIAFLSPIDFYRIEDIIPSLYEEGKTPMLVVLDGVTDEPYYQIKQVAVSSKAQYETSGALSVDVLVLMLSLFLPKEGLLSTAMLSRHLREHYIP